MLRLLHAPLVVLAALPWALGCVCFGLALLLVLAADRVWPNATSGNCWSFVGPRWSRWGGYLVVRLADDVVICGRRFIPHAMWLPEWPPDLPMQHTAPLKRSRNPLHTLYFPFRVKSREKPHDSTWQDL